MKTTPLMAALGVLATALVLGLAAEAKAEISFCPEGSGAGQCGAPPGLPSDLGGLAVDRESGRLFVADHGNSRVNAFDSTGAFLFSFGWGVDTGAAKFEKCTTASGCQKGISGSGAGQFATSFRSIAVDNSSAGTPPRHDVYVYDGRNFRVQVFGEDGSFKRAWGWGVLNGAEELQVCTVGCLKGLAGTGEGQFKDSANLIAVGPEGVVHVSDMPKFEEEPRIEKFTPLGGLVEEVEIEHEDRLSGGLAIDSTGNIYATFNKGGGAFKFEPDGSEYGPPYPLDPLPGPSSGGLAVDVADRLFAGQSERVSKSNGTNNYAAVAVYDPEGNIVRRFGYDELAATIFRPSGLAAHSTAQGDVFVNRPDGIKYLKVPPQAPIIPTASLQADPVRSVWATIGADVNPEGKATSYRIEYVDEQSFETEGGFASPKTKSTPDVPLDVPPGPEGFRLQSAETVAGCNPYSKAAFDEGKCLTPETSYRFRIVAEDSEGNEDEVVGQFETRPPLEFEATYATDVGTDAATLNASLNPLGSEASGYFEYVDEAAYEASGFAGAAKAPNVDAGELPISFGAGEATLARSVSVYPLAEGTSYRYRFIAADPFTTVTSEERSFTTFEPVRADACANEAFRAGPAALLPDCRAYELVSPLEKGNADIEVLGESFTSLPAVLEQSSLTGEKLAYGSYRAFDDAPSAPFTSQYIARRDAGAEEWVSHPISPPREEPLTNALGMTDTEFKYFTPDLCEAWIRTFADPPLTEDAVAGSFNLYRQRDDECGGRSYEALTRVIPPGGSTEPEVQGVSEDGAVTVFRANKPLATGATAGQEQLYITDGPRIRFLCVLPSKKSHKESCSAGTAASPSGQHDRLANVQNALSAEGSRVIWSTGTASGKIYQRQNPFAEGPECASAESRCTIDVSKAGEALSGTSKSSFEAAAEDGSRVLYTTIDNEKGISDLYEFEVAGKATGLVAEKVQGVLGASEDASRVYFVSTEALAGTSGATAGEPNLYLHESGEAGGQTRFIATLAAVDVLSATELAVARRLSRVTPDGLHAAFMSAASLTGYDNLDAQSGKPDAEVYLYDAAANGGEGELLCASCNPSGARPRGLNLGGKDENLARWTAAKIPGWQNLLYAARVLSPDGNRLYFESFDSLVARDTNGRQDVYQWEAEGTGGCEAADPSFVPDSGGCVDLISSGQSVRDSRFVDASPNGEDVFFATLSSLVSHDYGLLDIYDARVQGGFPPPPPPPPACEGDTCQSPRGAPSDPTPASASLRGQGDPKPRGKPRKARCPKGKRGVRRAGKRRCVPVKRVRAKRRQASRRAGK